MKDGFKKCLKMYQTPFQADDKKSKSTTTASTYFQTFTPVLTISEDFLDISESFLILASMFISRSRSSCRIWNVIFHVAGVKLGFPRVKIDFFIVTSSNSWSSLSFGFVSEIKLKYRRHKSFSVRTGPKNSQNKRIVNFKVNGQCLTAMTIRHFSQPRNHEWPNKVGSE